MDGLQRFNVFKHHKSRCQHISLCFFPIVFRSCNIGLDLLFLLQLITLRTHIQLPTLLIRSTAPVSLPAKYLESEMCILSIISSTTLVGPETGILDVMLVLYTAPAVGVALDMFDKAAAVCIAAAVGVGLPVGVFQRRLDMRAMCEVMLL